MKNKLDNLEGIVPFMRDELQSKPQSRGMDIRKEL